MTIHGKPHPGFPRILEIAPAIPTFPPHEPDFSSLAKKKTFVPGMNSFFKTRETCSGLPHPLPGFSAKNAIQAPTEDSIKRKLSDPTCNVCSKENPRKFRLGRTFM